MASSFGQKLRGGARKGWKGTRKALRLPAVWVPLLFVVAAGLGFGWGAWTNLCVDCPSIAQIHTWEPQQTSKVLDREGRLITELGIQRRTPISIDALPDHVPQAFIAIEDRRFYSHPGFDMRGISRALLARAIPRPVLSAVGRATMRSGGGSTITQQLARNMFEAIGYEVTVDRKLRELQVALELERAYSKDQIIEAYMNQINLGYGIWGIQTASRHYFGKNAVDLAPDEAALLAAIANNPGGYSPFNHPERSKNRRDHVLRRMAVERFLTDEEVRQYQAVPLPTQRAQTSPTTAPFFTEWVRQIAQSRFGSQLYTGGLNIYTSLDVEMQAIAEDVMREGFANIEARPGYSHPLHEDYQGEDVDFEPGNAPYLQGLFVVTDPHTGAVLALVGGRDFQQSEFNRVTQARRQPGSSFKTFVYAAALESGIPASHIITDQPVVRREADGSEWRPSNFDGTFEGDMTLRYAFRRSINTVAIQLADEEVGLETVAQTARRLGITTRIDRVPSMAIGSPDLLPIEIAEAYSTFATLGTKVRPFPILRVENAAGDTLWAPEPERQEVMDPVTARLMVHLLEDVVDRGTANSGIRGAERGNLPYDIPAAGKTGTTNNFTDIWFVGFTPNLQAAVWFGMDQPQRIYTGATGGSDAAPVWGEFMRRIYLGHGEENGGNSGGIVPIPERWSLEGLTTREVDDLTGLLASQWCPANRRYTEYYIPGTEPTEPCDDSAPSRTTPRWPWD